MADLHIGKMRHFRRNGSGIPEAGLEGTLARIGSAIEDTGAEEVIYLGDFFHTGDTETLEEIKNCWKLPVQQRLIPGNHDRLQKDDLKDMDIEMLGEEFILGDIVLTHIPPDEAEEGRFVIAGHVHPAVRVYGKGRQSLKLPCFYFGPQLAILPAMGEFTGSHTIKAPGRYIAIAEKSLWELT